MRLLLQIGIVFGICLLGEGISYILPFSFPPSIISMLLLLLFLFIKLVKVKYVEKLTSYLLRNMAFFFIPAGVAIMENYEYIQGSVLILLLICFITTVVTFLSTALTVKLVITLQNKFTRRNLDETIS